MSGVYLGCNFFVHLMRLVAKSPEAMCHFSNTAKFAVVTLHCIPLIAKGFQYIVLTNFSLHRRYPKFKSNFYLFKICMLLFVLNTLIVELLWLTSGDEKDHCEFDIRIAAYAFVVLGIILCSAVKVSSKISINGDSYSIGRELKVCYSLWAIIGLFWILQSTVKTKSGKPKIPWETEEVIGMFADLILFSHTIAFPLVSGNLQKLFSKRYRVHSTNYFSNWKNIQVVAMNDEHMDREAPVTNLKAATTDFEKNKIFSKITTVLCLREDVDNVLHVMFGERTSTSLIHKFADRHFIPEISRFLHAVYLYKFEESSNFQYERYKSMAATFIQSNAPYEINISYRVKSELLSWCENEKVEEGSNLRQDEIFDPACKEMFDLLYTNFFAKNASFCSF